MEINPQLFDDCSNDYTELQNSAAAREQARKHKWEVLDEQAKRRKAASAGKVVTNANSNGNAKYDADAMAQDSQKRLDALKLHDDVAVAGKQTSVS